jgi:Ni/Fe-hydrogenase subunit HybB-like protein
MLGYGAFIVSLIFDLGLPWHIYMPLIQWQHHSVMFEIAWCVMLYFSVLVMEFSPAILEHPRFGAPIFHKGLYLLHRATLPLVIAGIVLSTLHQSSLGSLFLLMPQRVHPLWYSPWIPVLFFTSAIAAGMMALVLEGFIAERWFGRGLNLDLLARLGKIAGFSLGLYLILRLGDLWLRGVLPGGMDGSWQSILFSAEILLGGVLPLILLSIKKVRERREGLLTCALLVIAGVISQRMSLSMFTMWRPEGTAYVPALAEVLIALAIPAAAILLYLFFTENLALIESNSEVLPGAQAELPPWVIEPQSSLRGAFTRRSGLAVVVVALILALLPGELATGSNLPPNPVQAAKGWEVLRIDGNSSAYTVQFPHTGHQGRLTQAYGSQEAACRTCHHLNFPDDQAPACWECHADYDQTASIFDHTRHQNKLGGNASCAECHRGEHIRTTALACLECHEDMTPSGEAAAFNYIAPSYVEAMHGVCQDCHQQEAQAQGRPELALCSTCHVLQKERNDFRAVSITK